MDSSLHGVSATAIPIAVHLACHTFVELDVCMLLIELDDVFKGADSRSGEGFEIAVESVLHLLLCEELVDMFIQMPPIGWIRTDDIVHEVINVDVSNHILLGGCDIHIRDLDALLSEHVLRCLILSSL